MKFNGYMKNKSKEWRDSLLASLDETVRKEAVKAGKLTLDMLPDGLSIHGCVLEGTEGNYHYSYRDVTLTRRSGMVTVTKNEGTMWEKTKRIRASNASWIVTLPG